MRLAWGNKVSAPFRAKVIEISQRLGIDPSHLMACMAFETGRTFSSSVRNAAGSGAVGLIQFMPQTAASLGTSTDELARMLPVCQLAYVEKYLAFANGRMKTLSDVYMAILWPAAIGKPDDAALFVKGDPKCPARYVQNAGLDYNHDGVITKGECAARVAAMLQEGMLSDNVFDVMDFNSQ